MIACFEKYGFEISRQGKDYLSIKNENGRNVRLKGAFYEQFFEADKACRAIAEAEREGSRESHRGKFEQAREQLQCSVKAKLRENRQRFENPRRQSKSKIAQAIQNTDVLCRRDRNPFGVGSVVSGLFSERLLGRDERMETVGGDIQSQQSKHGIQQMHDGRPDDQNIHSSRPTIQRPRMGKQYESFNDKGGLNEPDYEAVARGIERIKRDRQERVVRYYQAAQEEHERLRAEARSKIEANQRAIEQVRDRKSGIKELAQKMFERVRITVQKRIGRYQEKQSNCGKGL